jgi:hypothetical protein
MSLDDKIFLSGEGEYYRIYFEHGAAAKKGAKPNSLFFTMADPADKDKEVSLTADFNQKTDNSLWRLTEVKHRK